MFGTSNDSLPYQCELLIDGHPLAARVQNIKFELHAAEPVPPLTVQLVPTAIDLDVDLDEDGYREFLETVIANVERLRRERAAVAGKMFAGEIPPDDQFVRATEALFGEPPRRGNP